MKTLFLILSTLYLLYPLSLQAQAKGSLSGKLLNSAGEPVIYANITLRSDSLLYKTLSDTLGNFRIDALPAAAYTLRITQVGHKALTKDIFIGNDELLKLWLRLEYHPNFGKVITVYTPQIIDKSDTRQHSTFNSGQLRRMPIRN